MEGDRLKIYTLARVMTHKRGPARREIPLLSEILVPWFEKSVEKPNAKLEGCSQVWQEGVPAALLGRTRLIAFQRGTLTVAVDNTIVRAELDALLRQGLLKQLQAASKHTIFRVKTVIKGMPIGEIS